MILINFLFLFFTAICFKEQIEYFKSSDEEGPLEDDDETLSAAIALEVVVDKSVYNFFLNFFL